MDSAQNPGRLPKLEGIDYKQAAIDYPGKLTAERLHHLRTKPFYNLVRKHPKFRDSRGMDTETHREFCDFANIAVALELPPRARILDVACGSGWLSEYFARLGYDVTGIDISPDLIRISEERVRGVPYGVDSETPLRCRFLVHDVEGGPLGEKFDALVCYDAMHHFADEQAVARNLAAMLNVGGLLFILEGTKPPQGSPGEAELIDVMQRFETLESPFDAAYLREILDQNGLAVVGDYVSINALIDREALDAEGRIRPHLPAINYLLCKKVAEGTPASSVPDSRMPSALTAAIELEEPPQTDIHPGAPFVVRLKVANIGDTLWLGGNYMRRGAVMLGVKVLDADGKVVDEFHGEPALPRAMAPGESTVAVIERAAPAKPGAYSLKVDLVDQHICWFEERGSKPLVLPLEVR